MYVTQQPSTVLARESPQLLEQILYKDSPQLEES